MVVGRRRGGGGPAVLLRLTGIPVKVAIGVTAAERRKPTTLAIDLAAVPDLPAPAVDTVDHVLDYAALSATLREAASAQPAWQTLEALGLFLGETLRAQFPLASLQLTLHKNNAVTAPLASDVAIRLTWG